MRFLANISLMVTAFLVALQWALEGLLAQTKPLLLLYYVYHVVFDELLKETGHNALIIVSKYPEITHCNLLRGPLIEVKYNKISQLGILNGDRIRLIEVTA